jgi:hypothetical protein
MGCKNNGSAALETLDASALCTPYTQQVAGSDGAHLHAFFNHLPTASSDKSETVKPMAEQRWMRQHLQAMVGVLYV